MIVPYKIRINAVLHIKRVKKSCQLWTIIVRFRRDFHCNYFVIADYWRFLPAAHAPVLTTSCGEWTRPVWDCLPYPAPEDDNTIIRYWIQEYLIYTNIIKRVWVCWFVRSKLQKYHYSWTCYILLNKGFRKI